MLTRFVIFAIPSLTLLCIVLLMIWDCKKWRFNKSPFQVKYKSDGKLSEVMPYHIAKGYCEIFGGELIEAPGQPLARSNYYTCEIEE